jgi:DNA-binding transcriptional ArsR family regulator
MEERQAHDAFAALSQETRLGIFRFLMRQGSDVPAGQIAEAIGVPPSTFSFHVAALERAGLVKSQRLQRQILYSPNLGGIRALVTFLLQDCCGGRPEICADILGLSRTASACGAQVRQKAGRRAR